MWKLFQLDFMLEHMLEIERVFVAKSSFYIEVTCIYSQVFEYFQK